MVKRTCRNGYVHCKIHPRVFAEDINAIEPEISKQSDSKGTKSVPKTGPCFILAD